MVGLSSPKSNSALRKQSDSLSEGSVVHGIEADQEEKESAFFSRSQGQKPKEWAVKGGISGLHQLTGCYCAETWLIFQVYKAQWAKAWATSCVQKRWEQGRGECVWSLTVGGWWASGPAHLATYG